MLSEVSLPLSLKLRAGRGCVRVLVRISTGDRLFPLDAKASVIGKNSAEGQTFSVDLIVGFR